MTIPDPQPLELDIILADASVVDAATGKVNLLGGGWSTVPTPTPPGSVVLIARVPWSMTNEQLPLRVRLVNADGELAQVQPDDSGAVIDIELTLEVGRPPGTPRGAPITNISNFHYPPLALSPGRHEWQVEFASQKWSRGFNVITGATHG